MTKFFKKPISKTEQPVKGFRVCHKAWNAELLGQEVPEITIGIYYPNGSTEGEFGIRWQNLDARTWTPCLEAFCDSWAAFFQMPELHSVLREAHKPEAPLLAERSPSPEWMVKQLIEECGYTDLTDYERPA